MGPRLLSVIRAVKKLRYNCLRENRVGQLCIVHYELCISLNLLGALKVLSKNKFENNYEETTFFNTIDF